MTRFERELSGALGAYWKASAEKELAEIKSDLENGKITIDKNGKSAAATKLMALMGLGVKCGDTVTVSVEGADEEKAAAEMEKFFSVNL